MLFNSGQTIVSADVPEPETSLWTRKGGWPEAGAAAATRCSVHFPRGREPRREQLVSALTLRCISALPMGTRVLWAGWI